MSRFHVDVHFNAIFPTLPAARAIATGVRVLLKSGLTGHGSVRIYETGNGRMVDHAVDLPVVDKSKWVKGSQEAEGEVQKLTAEMDRANTIVAGEAGDDFWAQSILTAKSTGSVDHEALEVLASARYGDSTGVVSTAVGAVAAKAIAGRLNAARIAREKAAKRK